MRFTTSIAFLSFAISLNAWSADDSALQQALKTNASYASAIPATTGKMKTDIYIVQFIDDPVMAYDGGIKGMSATIPQAGAKLDSKQAKVKNYRKYLHDNRTSALNASGVSTTNIVYNYDLTFNGVAAKMSEFEANQLRHRRDVRGVWKDEMKKIDTDSTRGFLRLTRRDTGAWPNGYVGEDVIIGVIDTGIYPEHPSFADQPTHRYGNRGGKVPYGSAPTQWAGGACEFGNTAFNADDAGFTCNNKLLGARYFVNGFLRGGDPAAVLAPGSFLSARDDDGHGSAAASNAGGNFGPRAEIAGEIVSNKRISGVAPRARISAYKVCWSGADPSGDADGCANSDSMAAIDQAVADGVDVINHSIGGASVSFGGPDSISFLFAADAGVFVATSAGNSGSGAGTVGAPGIVPWITAAGAINDNQNFALGLQVDAPSNIAGTKIAIEGEGLVRIEDAGPLGAEIITAVPADGCSALTNPGDIDGKMALIIRGACAFDDKYANAEAAGALAIIVYNDGTADGRFDPFSMGGIDPSRGIPGLMIGFNDGDDIANAATPVATIDALNQVRLARSIAGFSSRGPNNGALDIIKPDLVAPGVNILSAETPFESANSGAGGNEYQYISGTSFSSPHTAGAFAILKQAHPDWTPAIARSALMTSARTNLTKDLKNGRADPFDIGAGLIDPSAALAPGLAYDAGLLDYAAFSCGNNVQIFSDDVCDFLALQGQSFDGSDLNLPSIGIGELIGSQTVTRTVTNVSKKRGRVRYSAVVKAATWSVCHSYTEHT